MIPAAILAGGQSRRLGGGDKCLLPFGNGTILDAVLAAVAPQAEPILINTNNDPTLFARFGLEVRADALPGQLGPLAAILTALLWAGEKGANHVVTVPGDTPFLPHDLVRGLLAAATSERPAVAMSRGQLHPVIGLWPVSLAAALERDLQAGLRAAHNWVSDLDAVIVGFDASGGDPFENINTPDDLARAQRRWLAMNA